MRLLMSLQVLLPSKHAVTLAASQISHLRDMLVMVGRVLFLCLAEHAAFAADAYAVVDLLCSCLLCRAEDPSIIRWLCSRASLLPLGRLVVLWTGIARRAEMKRPLQT